MQDIAQALGNSLSRDGNGSMRAPLAMGGYPVQNAAPGTGPSDLATVAQANANGVPIGMGGDFYGSIAPVGWLFCDGSAVSRSEYPELFAAIGTSFGAGDGATTFNLPDARGRANAGRDNMGGTAAGRLDNATALGVALGSQRHILTVGEMPSHTHGVSDPGHSHEYAQIRTPGGIDSGGGYGQYPQQTSSSQTGISIQSAGSGNAHNNVQPTLVCNKIIKARSV